MKTINVGLIGLGYIGKVHAIAYRDIPLCISRPAVTANLSAVLRSRLDTEQEAMQAAGFGVRTTSPDEFYSQPLQLVDVCTPNHLHLEQCRRALGAGIPVYCEKPLALDYAEAQLLADLAEKAGVNTQVAYVLRYLPAVRQMKSLLEAGEIGEPLHFRGHMFHGSYLDPNRPMSWRLRNSESGGGAFADLGSHLVDLVLYLLGEATSVRAQMRTFIRERAAAPGSGERREVTVDDWTLCSLDLACGASGSIEVTRTAAGASAESGFEIYGSKGAVIYHEQQPDAVRFFSMRKGEWIAAPSGLPPTRDERPIETVWPAGKYSQGMMTNAHMAAEYDLLLNLAEGRHSPCDFRSAAKVEQVLEAASISAQRQGELYKLE